MRGGAARVRRHAGTAELGPGRRHATLPVAQRYRPVGDCPMIWQDKVN